MNLKLLYSYLFKEQNSFRIKILLLALIFKSSLIYKKKSCFGPLLYRDQISIVYKNNITYINRICKNNNHSKITLLSCLHCAIKHILPCCSILLMYGTEIINLFSNVLQQKFQFLLLFYSWT